MNAKGKDNVQKTSYLSQLQYILSQTKRMKRPQYLPHYRKHNEKKTEENFPCGRCFSIRSQSTISASAMLNAKPLLCPISIQL